MAYLLFHVGLPYFSDQIYQYLLQRLQVASSELSMMYGFDLRGTSVKKWCDAGRVLRVNREEVVQSGLLL